MSRRAASAGSGRVGRMRKQDEATPRSRKDLLGTGVSRKQLAGELWVSPHHGVHRRTAVRDQVRQRIVDAYSVAPAGAVVGGWASAYLHGARHLDGRGEPVLLILPGGRQIRRSGIEVVRTSLPPAEVVTRHRLPCTNGTRTGFDLLRRAADLTEAVVAGDALLRAGLTQVSKLTMYADQHPRRAGVPQLREALPLVHAGAASPPESRLRLLCREAGLPPLRVNLPVYDSAGAFLGIPDLFAESSALAIEYDGDQHLELLQHTNDNLRQERLEAHGIAVIRVTSVDLKDKPGTIERLRSAHARRLDRDPTGEGWTLTAGPSLLARPACWSAGDDAVRSAQRQAGF